MGDKKILESITGDIGIENLIFLLNLNQKLREPVKLNCTGPDYYYRYTNEKIGSEELKKALNVVEGSKNLVVYPISVPHNLVGFEISTIIKTTNTRVFSKYSKLFNSIKEKLPSGFNMEYPHPPLSPWRGE